MKAATAIFFIAASFTALVNARSPAQALGAQAPVESPLDVFQKFVGDWEGSSRGKFGPAELEKTWSFVLNGHFLRGRTKSVAANDLHEDWSMLSYDKERKEYVLREFHSEGYVNQYLVRVEEDGTVFTFETESVENGFVPGLRARTTIRFVSEDEIHQEFALASPGKAWDPCAESELMKKKAAEEDR